MSEDKGRTKKHNRVKIIMLVIITLLSIASLFLIYNIWLLSGVEDIIRYIVIASLFIILAIFILVAIKTYKKGKFRSTVIFIAIALLFTTIQFIGFYYINKAYTSINKINKIDVTYVTSLVVMKDSKINEIKDLKNKKIGIIKEEVGAEDYIISKEIVKDNKIEESNLITYDDFLSMINDLYEGTIDGAFVSSNYVSTFSSIERFADIKDETKIIVSKAKEMPKQNTKRNKPSAKITKPFTMLVMGIDSTNENIKTTTSFNGDSLILITFNPKTLNTTMLSIPRDTFVPIMCFKNRIQNKITHAAWYGESCMIDTIENFTGINIDYYVKINFKGVVKLVDAVGGIETDVPYSFCEQNSNREWGKSTVYVKKGFQTLNGEQALAFARNRHRAGDGSDVGRLMSKHCPTYNEGGRSDFTRAQNQQAVITALANKIKSTRNINKVYEILDLVEKSMDTNLTTSQILSFYDIGKTILEHSKTADNIINFQKLFLMTYGLRIYDEGMKQILDDQIYYKGSLDDVVTAMEVNLELKEPTIIKEFAFSINEIYEEQIIGKGTYNKASIPLVPNFTEYTKETATSWGEKNGVSITFNTTESSDSKYIDGQIINQSVPQLSLVSIAKTKGITLTVIKKIENHIVTPSKLDCTDESNKDNDTCIVPDFIGKKITDINNWENKLTDSSINIIKKSTKTDVKDDDGKVFDQTESSMGKNIYNLSNRIINIEYYEYESESDDD